MATIGNYGVYEALLQTPVEGPEFADAITTDRGCDKCRIKKGLHFVVSYVCVTFAKPATKNGIDRFRKTYFSTRLDYHQSMTTFLVTPGRNAYVFSNRSFVLNLAVKTIGAFDTLRVLNSAVS